MSSCISQFGDECVECCKMRKNILSRGTKYTNKKLDYGALTCKDCANECMALAERLKNLGIKGKSFNDLIKECEIYVLANKLFRQELAKKR